MRRTIWIDVEDLFDYVRYNARPSGIQRLAFEVYRELQAARGDSVRFVRHAEFQGSFVCTRWDEVSAVYEALTHTLPPRPEKIIVPLQPVAEPEIAARAETPPLLLRAIRPIYLPLVSRLPATVRASLASFVWFQGRSIAALGDFVSACLRPASNVPTTRPQPPAAISEPEAAEVHMVDPRAEAMQKEAIDVQQFETAVRAGDTLLILGAPWFKDEYPRLLHSFAEKGGHVAVLIYDFIPLLRPEWCDHAVVERFSGWIASMLPRATLLFAISRSTEADIRRYARGADLAVPDRIVVVPIGSGFGRNHPATADCAEVTTGRSDRMPSAGSYVLFVSTIEARKNHALMFRVWRKLLEEMPAERVPSLVFAGRVGWLVADLMQQLKNTNFLDRKIVLFENPTDTEIEDLYRGCLFTVFPSLYEGWGLPVTESLRFGKPCVVADNTSLPEAGGPFARYFDAEDPRQAFRVIRETIEDAPGLAEWQARIAREFTPVPWRATAEAIATALDVLPDATGAVCQAASGGGVAS